MLKLMIGKAGTGKTAAVINEIKQAVDSGQPGRILLVPEQYSHEAERELCRRCGAPGGAAGPSATHSSGLSDLLGSM